MTIKADYHASIVAAPNLKDDSRNARLILQLEQDRQDATTFTLNADPGGLIASFKLTRETSLALSDLLAIRRRID